MRRGFTWLQGLVLGAVALVLAAMCYPMVNRSPDGGRRFRCQSNLKQIAFGFSEYRRDYDNCLPLLSAGEQGWAETLQPYLKTQQIFQCPSVNNATAQFSTDYFLNARVAGLWHKPIPFPAQTLLLGEGFDNGATNSHFSELPLDWRSDEKSPAKRHLDGANYAFVDGHVKWFKPEKITSAAPKNGNATFAVR